MEPVTPRRVREVVHRLEVLHHAHERGSMTPEMREEWRLLSKEATQIQRYVSGLRLGALSFIIAAAISIVAAAYLLWMEAPLWGVLGCWAAWLYCSLRVSQYNGKVRRLEDG